MIEVEGGSLYRKPSSLRGRMAEPGALHLAMLDTVSEKEDVLYD